MMLLLRDKQQDVSDERIAKCKTHKDALKLMKELSGYNDKQFCQELEIDPGTWSRIWNGSANFPDDEKLNKFIEMCESTISLRWYAMYCGCGIHPLKTAEQIRIKQLEEMVAERDKKLEHYDEFMSKITIKK